MFKVGKIHKIILIVMIVFNLIAPIVYIILYSLGKSYYDYYITAVCIGVILTCGYVLVLWIISLFDKSYWIKKLSFLKKKDINSEMTDTTYDHIKTNS